MAEITATYATTDITNPGYKHHGRVAYSVCFEFGEFFTDLSFMSTITREQAKDLRNAFQCWQQDYDPEEDKEQYDMFGLGVVAMDALLASLEAEPRGYIDAGTPDDGINILTENKLLKTDIALYTAPPAPVSVPDELAGKSFNYIANKFQVSISEAQWILVGWNAYRAAMLQGSQPVSKREQVRREHAEWSDKTFGDVGPVGPLKHLSKEALEAAAEPDDLSEWADMLPSVRCRLGYARLTDT